MRRTQQPKTPEEVAEAVKQRLTEPAWARDLRLGIEEYLANIKDHDDLDALRFGLPRRGDPQ